MEKQFKVGQVWRTRSGVQCTITEVGRGKDYPIVTSEGRIYCASGHYYLDDDLRPNDMDLAELVTDAPELSTDPVPSPMPGEADAAPEAQADPAHAQAPKFAVGQVWRTRDGGEATINSIDDDATYPVNSTIDCHTVDGLAWEGKESPGDLVTLLKVAPSEDPTTPQPEPVLIPAAPAAPSFAVGQVWERRDGHTVRIEQVEHANYSGELVARGEDRHWRRRSGRISDVTESPYDLVLQLPFDEPNAPAIADAMIADATGLAGDPPTMLSTPENFGDLLNAEMKMQVGGQQKTVSGATEEERVLFDALIIRSVDNSSIGATVNDLHHIQAIIAARRAL